MNKITQDQEQAKVQRSAKLDCGATRDSIDGHETASFIASPERQCPLKTSGKISGTSPHPNQNNSKKTALDNIAQVGPLLSPTPATTTTMPTPFLTAVTKNQAFFGCTEAYQRQEVPSQTITPFWVPNSSTIFSPREVHTKKPKEILDKGDRTDPCSNGLSDGISYPFICQVCCAFGTDQPDLLIKHAERNRSPVNSDAINPWITAHSGNMWFCRLCAYKSPLKANFQLHCKTEKHAQRLSLLLHVCEGGQASQAKVFSCSVPDGRLGPSDYNERDAFGISEAINMPPFPVQLLCLACDVYITSVHKFRVHCQCSRHLRAVEVFAHLTNIRSQLWSRISRLCLSFVQLFGFSHSPRTINNSASDRLTHMACVLSTIKVEFICEFPCCTLTKGGDTGAKGTRSFDTISKALIHWHTSEHQQLLAQQVG